MCGRDKIVIRENSINMFHVKQGSSPCSNDKQSCDNHYPDMYQLIPLFLALSILFPAFSEVSSPYVFHVKQLC